MDNLLQQLITMGTLAFATGFLKNYNWRMLLIAGTAFYVSFMFLFWLVVFDVVRNQWLVIFIDGNQTFAQNISYLVVMWAVVEMAPKGLEGTTLALATTVGNAGQAMGNFFVIFFNGLFQLDQKALEKE